MRLLGTEFPDVYNASGARNFDGKGYWYGKWFRLNWKPAGFIAKTTTLEPRLEPEKKLGNMPVKKDGITPQELYPKCIKINFLTAEAINSVGLTGPGAAPLLARGWWQNWREGPFILSFMSVREQADDRLNELKKFIELVKPVLKWFRSPVGLQLNFSCPNIGLDLTHVIGEASEAIEITATLRKLGVPIEPKFNPLVPVEVVCQVARHPGCDAIALNNTVPWGASDRINWKSIFGTNESPLKHLGGGGYSGPQALPIVIDLIRNCRLAGVTKPLKAGNGIQSKRDVDLVIGAGATGIELGTVAMVRPRRLQPLINHATERLRYVNSFRQ